MHTKLLQGLSGLPLTLVGLVLCGVGALLVAQGYYPATIGMAPGYAVLLLNLLLALFFRAAIRRSRSLLIFHIGLLLMMLIFAHSRLTYFKGWVEMIPGESFSAPSGELSKGPLFNADYARLQFQQAEFFAYFNPDRTRQRTDSFVTRDHGATLQTLSDQNSLIMRGYNVTVSNEVGFAALFTWLSNEGELTSGYVNFPSQLSFRETQYNQFELAGVPEAIQLKLAVYSDRTSYFEPYFKVPEDFEIVLRVGSFEDRIRPGDLVPLAQGTLRFDALTPWIGYDLYYDANITLLLLTTLATVVALTVFLIEKMAASDWQQTEPVTTTLAVDAPLSRWAPGESAPARLQKTAHAETGETS